MGRNAILVLVLIERRDWNVAVDANRRVHYDGRACGIVHGEREIVPASPWRIRPRAVEGGSPPVRLDAASLSHVGTCRNLVTSSERIPDARGIFHVRSTT